mmetsp:Transcript_117231/g.331724  ORF Transcript_117231/g.331724 Transcript_117231/m.331724 type:complete len:352 (-) Transcript_117231:103-1158(-)
MPAKPGRGKPGLSPKAGSSPGSRRSLKFHHHIETLRPELKFFSELTPAEAPNGLTWSQASAKSVALMREGIKKNDEELLHHAFAAVERLCVEGADAEAFFELVKNEGVETVGRSALESPHNVRRNAESALAAIYLRASSYLDVVDPVDFFEVPNVMFLGNALAVIDEDVALSTLAAMERFAMHRIDNAISMLEQNALQLFHLLLSAHRSPEVCHETLTVMFRLCDLPNDTFASYLLHERELIPAVVEMLNEAQLNMRLQVAGLRLLCLWNQPEVFPEDTEFADKEDATMLKDQIRAAMKEAGAVQILERAVDNLTRGGLHHQAAWFSCMAGGTLTKEMLRPRVGLLPKQHA